MKKLLLVVAFLLGLSVVKVHANGVNGWVTFTSTNVCLSTGSQLELLRITYSTGSSALGDSWFVAVDSNPLAVAQTGTTGTGVVHGMNYTPAAFPVTQYIVPPTVLFTTATANGLYSPAMNVIDFRNADGSGKPIKNGLVFFKNGTNYGTIFSVEYRKKR